eukprot:TRINITY_DN9804_c0_g3_i1.p1 TRINITY_DN9804_c0_g3~~TRINITY_DN9804_c0_g3_i1.p1  ORF type:complete len:859 (+),score=186.25 TRINITY_DN9804_c0_g3_i1:59-2635(+)
MAETRSRNSAKGPKPASAPLDQAGSGKQRPVSCRNVIRTLAIGGVGTFVILLTIVFATKDLLPAPQPTTAPANVFAEDRAMEDLTREMAIGRRLVGTKANEAAFSNYLLRRLHEINDLSCESASGTCPSLEIMLHNATGAFPFWFIDRFIHNTYTNITNVAVRISNGQNNASHAPQLLVNAHFDSGISAPGASDAAACVAVLLEVVRALRQSDPLQAAVIVLFNGAEESLQQGSHAFIALHPWAKSVRALINLDSAGGGGPALLVQTGSARIASLYAQNAPRPHGTALAQDLFINQVIPSDTDYRNFQFFGKIGGLDLVYYRDGYTYHTDRDVASVLPPGSLQHMGGNVLAAVRALVSDDVLSGETQGVPVADRAVYFDVLGGRIMLAYSQRTALLATLAIAMFSLVMVWRGAEGQIGRVTAAAWSVTVSLLAAVIAPALVGVVLAFVVRTPLSWFSQPALGTAMFGAVSLLTMALLQWRFAKMRPDTSAQTLTRDMYAGVILFNVGLSLLLSFAGLGSAYLPSSWALSLSVSWLIAIVAKGDRPVSLVGAMAIGTIVPGLLCTETVVNVITFFVPLGGRMGYAVPADIVIGGLAGLLCSITYLPLVATLHATRAYKHVVIALALTVAVLLAVSFVVFPYTYATPKRLFVQHLQRAPPADTKCPTRTVHTEGEPVSVLQIGMCDAGPKQQLWNEVQRTGAVLSKSERISDWDALQPFATYFGSSEFPAPSLEGYGPCLTVRNDSYNADTDERTFTLHMSLPNVEWSTLSFTADVLWWSLGYPPEPSAVADSAYVIRHVGGHGTKHWNVSLRVRGKQTVQFRMTGTHFAPSEAAAKLAAVIPEWAAVAYISTYNYLYEV